MLVEIIEGALALVALGVVYFEIKSRRVCWKVQRVDDEDKTKPKVIPFRDPVIDIGRAFLDIFCGKGLRGEYMDHLCRRLLTEDTNGSRDLQWLQSSILGIHFINTWDADSVREILFSKDDVMGKQDFGQELNKKFISESILNVEGDEWKRQKKLLSPAFSHEHLKFVAPEIVIITDQLVEKLAELTGKPLKIHPIMQKATLEIIGKSGFGVSFGALTESKKSTELENYENLMKEFQNPIHFFTKIDALLGTKKKLYRMLDDFEKYMFTIVDNKRKQIEEKGDNFVPTDILDLLVMGHDSEEGILNDRQLIHNLNTFFIAGHETTAAAVSSTIHLLADHPDHQQKLFEEIDRVCGNDPPTYDQLKEMDYLHNCLKEAIRLFPPAPIMVRKAKEDVVISGYKIPKDSTFGLWVYTIHRDPRYWENPDSFDPDRFLDSNKHKRHRYAWIPFSLGPRQCIGNNLAFMEMKMMLIRVLQNFRVVPDPLSEKPNVPYMGLVVQPHPKNSIILQSRH